MSATIKDRPQGHVFSPTAQTATVTDNGGAYFNCVGHGMIDSDYCFIDSPYTAYNGHWFVDRFDVDNFWIRPYDDGTKQPYVNYRSGETVTFYRSIVAHNWNAVHLPIVYKLASDAWPTNAVDTIRTVSSISNDSGYVNLNLSGDIKATGSAAELEFVQVFGQNAGIYQIINYISDSDITIDMPYVTGLTFAGSTVQYYYNNYHIRVKIFAGLKSTHYWALQNPYEEIMEVNIVPDENGIADLNIADFLKTKIQIDKNDAALDTLPNDINSFCQFYIWVYEVYTYSNGYTLGTSVTSMINDSANFEGYAVNSMLPFKTESGGFMDDYVSGLTADTPQMFLSVMTNPEIFDGQYFDLSFILNSNSSGFYILEQYKTGGGIMTTVKTDLPDYDAGVYRFQVTYNSAYEYVCVSLYNSANLLMSEIKEIKINAECSSFYTDIVWKNFLGGHDYWRFNAAREYSNRSKNKEVTTNYFTNWPKSWGKFADTIRKNGNVESSKNYTIRSQPVTNQQAEDLIGGIETALLVQEQTSLNDRRTIIIDSSNKLDETDKLKEVIFNYRFTDDNPTQSL